MTASASDEMASSSPAPSPLIVVNLWAPPSSGKTTLAAGLFYAMKRQDMRVEMVAEAAKDWLHEDTLWPFSNQFLVLAEQYRRLVRLRGKYTIALCDSPLPLCLFYETDERTPSPALVASVPLLFAEFTNVNLWIESSHAWRPDGRRHDAHHAARIKPRLHDFMVDQTETHAVVNMESPDPVATALESMDRLLPSWRSSS